MLARLPAFTLDPLGSGWPDSNRRPPAPKAGALTKLRHIPWNRSVAYRPFAGLHGAARPPWRGSAAAATGQPRRQPSQSSREFAGPARPPDTGRSEHVAGFGLDGPNRYAVRAHPVPVHTFHRARGRSSMAEPQPSKLVMRVRFPSPAPTCNPRSGT